jgi:hypothetical protein
LDRPIRRFGQIIRQRNHFSKCPDHLDDHPPIRDATPEAGKVILPATEARVLKNKGLMMNDKDRILQSSSTSIVFFTVLSSATAIATALLPFFLQN